MCVRRALCSALSRARPKATMDCIYAAKATDGIPYSYFYSFFRIPKRCNPTQVLPVRSSPRSEILSSSVYADCLSCDKSTLGACKECTQLCYLKIQELQQN